MDKKSKKPELLAPAGNIVSAITALDAGADAVYAGLSHFNARARTENFTVEELAKTITYAHSKGKKVYVTLNTIIKEQELANFAKIVATVASLEADAVIVQDFGALRIIRDYFPMLAIHASTQMGIHNLPGCKLAKELGIKRVILERQMSFEELSSITASSPVEIEIFIHGALCCSISGSCLLSSWVSGESGNRGECKQNCRRKFLDSCGREGYFLSTKDMCLLEDIPKIKNTRIASLKIEGRLKKNDYVQNTVRAYRIVLDADEKNLSEAIKEAKEVLVYAYGRKTIRLFSGQKPFCEMLNPTESGTTGVLCGKVLKSSNDGFYLLCKRKIHLGDRLRLQSPDQRSTCILTLNKMIMNRMDVVECLPGRECFIPSSRMPKPGANAYKIGESIPDFAKKIANLPTSIPRPISVKIKINNNGLFAEAKNPFATLNWSHKVEFFPARQHPITKEKIVEEFSKSNSKKLFASNISVEIDGDIFIPQSILKEFRRDFWFRAIEFFNKSESELNAESSLKRFFEEYSRIDALSAKDIKFERSILVSDESSLTECEPDRIIVRDIFSPQLKNADEVLLPAFCPESKIKKLEEAISNAYLSGIRRFRCQSAFEIELLKKYADVKIVSCYPFAAANSMAVCEFRNLGVSKVQIWPELDKISIEELRKKSPLSLEIWNKGRIPLMLTRAEFDIKGLFKDEMGNEFYVEKIQPMNLSAVYSVKVLNIPPIDSVSEFSAYFKNPSNIGTIILNSSFNFARSLK